LRRAGTFAGELARPTCAALVSAARIARALPHSSTDHFDRLVMTDSWAGSRRYVRYPTSTLTCGQGPTPACCALTAMTHRDQSRSQQGQSRLLHCN